MEVYPKVKVRHHDDDDQCFVQEDDACFPMLDVFESLSLQEHRSPSVSSLTSSGKEDLDDSPPSIARISKFYVPNSVIPQVSLSKGTGKNVTELDKDGRNIRASPVLRPRAVLSSPDNDGMIGNRSQISRVKPSVTKKHELGLKEPAQGKINSRSVKTTKPQNLTKGSKESILKDKGGLETRVTKQKPYMRKGKLNI